MGDNGEILLVRHGQTEWAAQGRHTGRTDVPLTQEGRRQARAVGTVLAGRRFALVLISPLERAQDTAHLAGLDEEGDRVETDPDLLEWDYGAFEGLTTPQIQADGRPGWSLFRDGVIPGETPGETLAQVAERGRRVIDRVRPLLEVGDVALVGHGHALRVLSTAWLEQDPELAARLVLGPGSISSLGAEHAVPAITGWNRLPSGLVGERSG